MSLPGYIILALLATSFVGSAQDESTVYAIERDPDTGWMMSREPLGECFCRFHFPGCTAPLFYGALKYIWEFSPTGGNL